MILHYLRTHGPADAASIRHALGLSHEAVYAELVALEAAKLVRINVDGYDSSVRQWEAM